MGGKSAEQLLHEFRGNAAADVTMSLLRSHDALLHLALMAAHLGDGRIIDGETLTADIDKDIPRLLHSYVPPEDDAALMTVPDADALLMRWTKKGWVHRIVDPETRIERYQLTSGAAQAVRQMRNLRRHTSVATESALAMVMAEIHQIATEANPDPAVRREAIDEQIELLEAQREALDRGEVPLVHQRELIDKVSALTHLIERIPADIARYGEQMQANTTALIRQSLRPGGVRRLAAAHVRGSLRDFRVAGGAGISCVRHAYRHPFATRTTGVRHRRDHRSRRRPASGPRRVSHGVHQDLSAETTAFRRGRKPTPPLV